MDKIYPDILSCKIISYPITSLHSGLGIRYMACIRWRISLSTRQLCFDIVSYLFCRHAQFPEREARLDLGHPGKTLWRVALSTLSQPQITKFVQATKDTNTCRNC